MKTKILLIAIAFIIPFSILYFKEFGGNSDKNLTAYESYLEENFYAKEKTQSENELEGEEELKTDRPDLAIEQDFRLTMDPVLKRPTPEVLILARQQIKNLQRGNASLMAPIWNERGPNNVGGRTRAIAYDPNDLTNKKVWVGSVGGGLWYCEDIGATILSWNKVNDFWDNIAISCITFDPINPQNIYVGTGEGWSNVDAQRGAGIWKSTDAGTTWLQLSTTNNSTYYNVQKMVVNSSGLYVATKANGVMRSTDAGITFTKVLGSSTPSGAINQVADLEIGSDGTIYAGLGMYGNTGSIWKSKLGTAGTWTKINTSLNGMPTTGFERIEIATAPSDSNVLYAVTQDASTNGLFNIYYSANKGTSWTTCAQPNDADSGIPDTDFTRGQAWYDLIAAVDPLNANTLLVGGVDIFKSTNSGAAWTQITHWYGGFGFPNVHADQHAIVYKKNSSSEVLFGNDGGIFRSTNLNIATPAFSNRNLGYNVTQFYSCAMSPTSGSSIYLAGAQDNGTHRFTTANINSTTQVYGGDGAFCFIDQDNPNIAIASYVYNSYHLSTNGGSSFGTTLSNNNSGSFINPADYDDRENILYSGYSNTQYQRILNVTGTPSTTQITVPNLGANISHFRVSPYAPIGTSTLFIGTEAGKIFKITNAQSANPTFTPIGFTFPGAISCIEIGSSENELIITLSNYGIISVYYTSDGGINNANKEGNLPNMPIRWALFNPLNRNEVMVATELGVWFTSAINNTTPTWVPSNSGLANTRVTMLQYRSSDNLVIASTHGRGLYSCANFTSNITVVPVANFTASKINACVGETISFTDNSSNSPIAWSWTFNGGNVKNSNLSNPQIRYDTAGTFDVTLIASNILGPSNALTKTGYITVSNVPAISSISGLSQTCMNDTTLYVSQAKENGYTWTITGGQIISGQNTDSINVVWTAVGNKTVAVKLLNAAGCIGAVKNFPVKINNQPSSTDILGTVSTCEQDTASYSVTVSNSTNLTWNIAGGIILGKQDSSTINVIWNQASSVNEVSVMVSSFTGCNVVTKTLLVNTSAKPIASFSSNIDTVDLSFGGAIQFQNLSSNANNYFWDFGDSTANSTVVSPLHIYNKTGTFLVSLSADNGNCLTTITKPIVVIQGVGINNQKLQKKVSVSPNPTSAIIHIKLNELKFYKAELINLQGKIIKTFYEETNSLADVANANYLLRIYTNEGIVEKKILKN